jgi:hypothetical protein
MVIEGNALFGKQKITRQNAGETHLYPKAFSEVFLRAKRF